MKEKVEEISCSNCGKIIEGDYFGCKECVDLFCCNQCFENHPCEVERKARIEEARLFDEEKAKIAQAEEKLLSEKEKKRRRKRGKNCDFCGAPAIICQDYPTKFEYFHSFFCSEKCKTRMENQWRIKGVRPGLYEGTCGKVGWK